jgi:hypothetical protein
MFKKICSLILTAGVGCSIASAAGETPKKKNKLRAEAPVEIKVVPVGPTQEQIDRIQQQVEANAAVQKELNGTFYRKISFQYLESNDNAARSSTPEGFRVVYYDYTNERTVVAEGGFAAPDAIRVYEEAANPADVSEQEFNEAARIIEQSVEFGAAARAQKLAFFPPMPPTTRSETGERLINVGIEPRADSVKDEIISVALKNGKIVRYGSGAPPISKASPDNCGIQNAGQPTTPRGTAGESQVTVSQNGTTLWEFSVIRPSVSSGTRSSGVELVNVKYRGKSVLKRAHVPILNVEYVNNVCGPYRDWQWQEGAFQAPDAGAQNPVPGIRVLADGQIATTALETGNDVGNFRGVAIYRQNNETVLVSEMDASWYRYIMEWRLANDGTIRPRFGLGAVKDSCVCAVHNHHVYWRLDFDIVGVNNNIYQVERGRKFLRPVDTEIMRLRSYQTNRSFLVQNATGDEAYMIVPNRTDGVADTYGRGDFWFLRYKNVTGGTNLQNEIDDGYSQTGGPGTPANLAAFLNNETLTNQDVVVWYGAHFIHNDGQNLLNPDRSGSDILSGSHVIGPDIRPVRW